MGSFTSAPGPCAIEGGGCSRGASARTIDRDPSRTCPPAQAAHRSVTKRSARRRKCFVLTLSLVCLANRAAQAPPALGLSVMAASSSALKLPALALSFCSLTRYINEARAALNAINYRAQRVSSRKQATHEPVTLLSRPAATRHRAHQLNTPLSTPRHNKMAAGKVLAIALGESSLRSLPRRARANARQERGGRARGLQMAASARASLGLAIWINPPSRSARLCVLLLFVNL